MNRSIINVIKASFLILFFVITNSNFLQSQSAKRFGINVNVGHLIHDISSNRFAGHIGINPHFKLTERFYLEAQTSLVYRTYKNNTFKNDALVNGLVGGKYYLLNEDEPFRPYINLMVGVVLQYYPLFNDEPTLFRRGELSYSTGLFMEYKKHFVVGLSAETSVFNLLLKAGYKF